MNVFENSLVSVMAHLPQPGSKKNRDALATWTSLLRPVTRRFHFSFSVLLSRLLDKATNKK